MTNKLFCNSGRYEVLQLIYESDRTYRPYTKKVKVKCTFVQALRLCTGRTAHKGSRGIPLIFLEGGEGSASRPGRSLTPGKTRYPLYRRLRGPQGRSGQVRKISPPPGFDPRTVQPVASRYTDWATRPTSSRKVRFKNSAPTPLSSSVTHYSYIQLAPRMSFK